MNLFLDHLWIWIVLTVAVGICVGVWYQNNQTRRNLFFVILLPILTLTLGLTLFYGVDTDRKTIVRMLDGLIVSIENDDLKSVHGFISERAVDVRDLAERGMRLVTISKAKYHNLEIEVNDAASPPVAKIRFSAVFYWKNKNPIDGLTVDQPIPERTQFEIELVKTKEGTWRVNKCPPPRMRFQ